MTTPPRQQDCLNPRQERWCWPNRQHRSLERPNPCRRRDRQDRRADQPDPANDPEMELMIGSNNQVKIISTAPAGLATIATPATTPGRRRSVQTPNAPAEKAAQAAPTPGCAKRRSRWHRAKYPAIHAGSAMCEHDRSRPWRAHVRLIRVAEWPTLPAATGDLGRCSILADGRRCLPGRSLPGC
jgi:hypothetical protein